jgi:hypothetical protein
VAQVFVGLEAQALQATGLPLFRFNDIDFEPMPEPEPMGQCSRCQCPMHPMYIDESGVCDDCHLRYIHDIVHTPPLLRTEKDWRLLEALGYVDVYDDESAA